MKAIKCDRCGKYFDKDSTKIKINLLPTQDLCEECAKILKDWIKGKDEQGGNHDTTGND